ncbi:MAG TPA: 23S rRNA (uracil(1939)-C(5))-methyltransferase RlmD [Rhabdochlamydiaceae bacterium]|jgi:23S rRNA (uracil1939-C5)-methyltransferase|nr:23S rRNA (uracil(1939)-C(5))-methyltransferase RlmD [Rhabdochlamydiaceae bacterium]
MNPLCIHFPDCGGCTSQHIPYADQLLQKQAEIEKIFDVPVAPIIPCKEPFHYRNKMEFSFSQDKAGRRYLGLILRKSRGKVFNLQECLISPPWMSETLQRVRSWWESTTLAAFNFRSGLGSLRTLILREGRRTGDRLAMLTVSGDPRFALNRKHLNGFIQALNDPQMSIFLRVQQAISGKPTQFYEMHLGGPDHIKERLQLQGRTLSFKISPTSFFQPNTEQAEVLYNQAIEIANMSPQATVYDLYCGTATLGMAFALKAEKVIAIELNPHAVFDAKTNAEVNKISNIDIQCGDVGMLLSQTSILQPDLAIVDPPRPGLDPLALEALKRLQPQHILYVSCNPKTQAQNIAELSGYQIIYVQPVDQFPHTPHIENIVLLLRL